MEFKIKQLFPSKNIYHRLVDINQEFLSENNTNDNIWLSFETSIQCRKFLYFDFWELCYWFQQTNESDRSMYEVIPPAKPVKLYIDFEYYLLQNHDIANHATGLKCILKVLQSIFNSNDVLYVSNEQFINAGLEQWLVLSASTVEKVSYHIIHAEPTILFENNQMLGLFIRSTISYFLELVMQHKCPNFSMNFLCKNYSLRELVSLLAPHIYSMRIQCTNCLVYGQSISASDIAHLLVMNKKHEWTLAVDTHVYSKNQQFRLFGCVKIAQNNPLIQMNAFPFQIERKHCFNDILHASLITHNQSSSKAVLRILHNSFIIDLKTRMFSFSELNKLISTLNEMNVCLKCNSMQNNIPSEIDQSVAINKSELLTSTNFFTDFVKNIIKSDPNQGGFIRSQLIGTRNPDVLIYNIGGNYRFCPRKGSHHLRNNVCILIDKVNYKFAIRCKDPECDNSILIWNKIK